MGVGDPVGTPWDPELANAMERRHVAVFEEQVIEHLLTDLASPQKWLQAAAGNASLQWPHRDAADPVETAKDRTQQFSTTRACAAQPGSRPP
jgi:hypothetical protein